MKPGATVELAARGLPPLTTVSLFSGANRRELTSAGEATTNAAGELFTDVKAKKSTDLGGVIFAAAIGDIYLYSPRVSVVKLKNETAK